MMPNFRRLLGPGDFSPADPDDRADAAFEQAREELGADADEDDIAERAGEILSDWQDAADDEAIDRGLARAEDRGEW